MKSIISKPLVFLASVLFILFLAGCSGTGKGTPESQVYWINSLKVPCVGAGPMRCLQIQKNEKLDPTAWSLFYGNIKGFEFEPGYLYKVLVDEKQLSPEEVPADAPSVEYTLVKVLKKVWDKKVILNDTWILKGMEGKPLDTYPGYESLETPQLDIKVIEMQYAGSDGCNRVIGGLIALDESEIKFGVGAGTRKACPNMEIPDRFNRLIQQVNNYRVERGHLFLFDADGKELLEFVKAE